MSKIQFEQFEKMMAYDVLKKGVCIEVSFFVDDLPEYNSCWLGKTFNSRTSKEIYWYGLVKDDSQAYDFESLHDFVNAPVFHGNSIKEIWNLIMLISIDSCAVEDRLNHYLGLESGSVRRSVST
jgi:hypothetical protein